MLTRKEFIQFTGALIPASLLLALGFEIKNQDKGIGRTMCIDGVPINCLDVILENKFDSDVFVKDLKINCKETYRATILFDNERN